MTSVMERLLASDEPSVRYKVLVHVLGRDPESPAMQKLRREIRDSARVRGLLSERDATGNIPYHPYKKWYGAHWVLSILADIGYPSGDRSLKPLREGVYRWLLAGEIDGDVKAVRMRRHASQEGNALYAMLALSLADEQSDELARRLMKWQWPDGGWNCDRRPEAVNSSFHETITPMRGLALYARARKSREAAEAVKRAADIFLKRRMFRRLRDGEVMHPDFLRLHYPCYWHYDVLMGLKVMAEAGLVGDARCVEALDWLESRRLPAGGWPADKKYYRVGERRGSGRSPVSWGMTSAKRMNEWVTADALTVLKAAGRLREGE